METGLESASESVFASDKWAPLAIGGIGHGHGYGYGDRDICGIGRKDIATQRSLWEAKVEIYSQVIVLCCWQ